MQPKTLTTLYDNIHKALFVAFVVVNLLPSNALAFSQEAESAWQPLTFSVPVGQIHSLLFVDGKPRQPSDIEFRAGMQVSVWASAYSSTVSQTDADPFTTAAGTRVRSGIIAANFLPLGTRVRIKGQEYVVEDRLNSRYNDQYMIDIWMGSFGEAMQFGVRMVTMEIVSLP